MSKTGSHSLIILTAILGIVTPQFARAQTHVSITITNSPVWDVDRALTDVDFSVTNRDDSTEVSASFPMAVAQTGTGKLTGGPADTSVELSMVGANSPNASGAAAGTYKVTGSITSNHGKGHVLINITTMTTEAWSNPTRQVRVIKKITGKLDSAALTITGTELDSVTQIGGHHAGTLANRRTFTQPLTDIGDGSWTLALTLTTDVNKITGTAIVTLNSGQTFTYNAKGIVKHDGTSNLLLTGADANTGRGAFRVALSADGTVSAVKGKVTGQMVNVTF